MHRRVTSLRTTCKNKLARYSFIVLQEGEPLLSARLDKELDKAVDGTLTGATRPEVMLSVCISKLLLLVCEITKMTSNSRNRPTNKAMIRVVVFFCGDSLVSSVFALATDAAVVVG